MVFNVISKKRGCCEERRHADGEREENLDIEPSQTKAQPSQTTVFANALRDPCKKGARRALDPRGCIVSDDFTRVTRKPQRTHCFVIGETPLKFHPGKGWYFEVQIEAVNPGQIGGLATGVTTASSSKISSLDWRARAVPDSWLAGYWGQVSAEGQQQQLDWHPDQLAVKDRVGFLVLLNGECAVHVNRWEVARIEKFVPVTSNKMELYALVDIFSHTSSVTFLDSTPPKRRHLETQDMLPAGATAAPAPSCCPSQPARAEVQAEASVTRQDLKDKLAKKLAGKASVRGKKQPVKGKHKDPVELLKGKATTEKCSVASETAKEEPDQGLIQPVKGLTMYQTCVLARLAAEKKLRLSTLSSEHHSSASSAKQETKLQAMVAAQQPCETKSVQSSSGAKAKPSRKTASSRRLENASSKAQRVRCRNLEDEENTLPTSDAGQKPHETGCVCDDQKVDVVNKDSEKKKTTSSQSQSSASGDLEVLTTKLGALAQRDPNEEITTYKKGARTAKRNTKVSRNCQEVNKEQPEGLEDLQKTDVQEKEDPSRNCKAVLDISCKGEVSAGIKEIEPAAFSDKAKCTFHEYNQNDSYEVQDDVGAIQSIAPADNDVKEKSAKHGEPHRDTSEEKEEVSSSSQPEEEPQIASIEEPSLKDIPVCERAEVEPAPEASPVSCPPCSFSRDAEPLWVVPGVPRKCGMAGYLSVACMGEPLFSDDDRVDVVCTAGCVAAFHASCYKCFRRPPDRSCLDTACTGKLCRIWKTSVTGDVTVVIDEKPEQDPAMQAPSKSSGSTSKTNSSSEKAAKCTELHCSVLDKAAKSAECPDKAAKASDSQDKAAKTSDSQDKVHKRSCKVASEKKKPPLAPAPKTLGKGCARSSFSTTGTDSHDEIQHVKESWCVHADAVNGGGTASRADTSLQPTKIPEQVSRRGVPDATELQKAARKCKTGDFMVLAPWDSGQHWGDQESLAVKKGGVVYVTHVDQQGWALATCRRTQNTGWLPSDFLCRCIYTANRNFSNSIRGYSVIAKGELVSVFHRDGCWIYGATLANADVQSSDCAGAEDWKQIGWYPAELIGS